VNAVVDFQVRGEGEGLGTFLAFIRLLAGVDQNMALEIPRAREHFIAMLARVRLLASSRICIFFLFY